MPGVKRFSMKAHLSILVAAGLFAPPAGAAGAWITLGDAAYVELKKVIPNLLAKDSRIIRTSDAASKAPASEKVHMLEVDEDQLLTLSGVVHGELKRCGGFMYHASEADALKALDEPALPAPQAPGRPAYVIANQALVTPALAQMQDSNIAQTIAELAGFANRYYTTAGGSAAADWLAQKWDSISAGRSDITVTQFAHPGYRQTSVILSIEGSDKASEVVVIGGHIDSINGPRTGESTKAPGADDDASGIAGITEALRSMVANGYKPRRTIKLIGYAAEEVGLRGSQAIARNFKTNGINVLGVMQLDMINYKGSPSDIYIYTDYTDTLQNEFIARLVATYLPTLTIAYDKCGYGCSDHVSWRAQGYAASMPFESAFRQDNPHIHTANDTYANSGNQALHALKFARIAAAYAIELGSEGASPPAPADK